MQIKRSVFVDFQKGKIVDEHFPTVVEMDGAVLLETSIRQWTFVEHTVDSFVESGMIEL